MVGGDISIQLAGVLVEHKPEVFVAEFGVVAAHDLHPQLIVLAEHLLYKNE